MDKIKLATDAAKGDETSFLQLMELERRQLYRIALSYLKNEPDALEALQETVCRAWLKRRDLRKPQYMTTWIIRILIHVCSDELKRRKRSVALDHDPAWEDRREFMLRGEGMDELMSAEGRMDFAYAIEVLDSPYREVIILKYEEDMTLTDIAEILQRPVGTVKTWLHKALTELRTSIERKEERDQDGRLERRQEKQGEQREARRS